MAARRAIQRPKNLNLLSIRLPVPALVSILHRVSGFALFLALPVLLLGLQTSLASESGYLQAVQWLQSPPMKLLQVLVLTALCHHLLAGLRHLVMDVHGFTELPKARLTAKLVLGMDALVLALLVLWWW